MKNQIKTKALEILAVSALSVFSLTGCYATGSGSYGGRGYGSYEEHHPRQQHRVQQEPWQRYHQEQRAGITRKYGGRGAREYDRFERNVGKHYGR